MGRMTFACGRIRGAACVLFLLSVSVDEGSSSEASSCISSGTAGFSGASLTSSTGSFWSTVVVSESCW